VKRAQRTGSRIECDGSRRFHTRKDFAMKASLRARPRHAVAAAVFAASLMLAVASPANAANSTTRILRVPLNLSLFLPCADEVVNLTGTFIDLFHVTFDQDGAIHLHLLETQSSVAGFGETTGDRYVSTRVNIFNFSDATALTSTQEMVFHVIGQGPGNDALIRLTNHSTLNADGTLTVAFDNLSVECEPTSP